MAFRIRLEPSGLTWRAAPDEPLLAPALARGIAVPWACRNGVCERCEARLLAGEAEDGRTGRIIGPGETLLTCRCTARADLTLRIDEVMAAGEIEPVLRHCTVRGVEPLNHDVFRVRLQLPPGQPLQYHAGQYLAIELPGDEPAWFSIASAPQGRETRELELHIQAVAEETSAQGIIDYLRREPRVPVRAPFGRACLAAVPERPLLLVAAGTGFAQMTSLVEWLRAHRPTPPVYLYWGVRRHEDMYLRNLPDQWARDWPAFHFYPLVGDSEDNDWEGHHEQLARKVLAGGHDLGQALVIASGSPPMAYTLMDRLVEAGLDPADFLSDVLEYAPR